MTREAFARSATDHFAIVLLVLATAAAAAFLVGGLGLATSMSLNVLERAREIGVMRAIGATSGAVPRLLALEGAAVALASALLAAALALPLSAAVGRIVGEHGLHAELPFTVSLAALGAWSALTAVVAALCTRSSTSCSTSSTSSRCTRRSTKGRSRLATSRRSQLLGAQLMVPPPSKGGPATRARQARRRAPARRGRRPARATPSRSRVAGATTRPRGSTSPPA